MSDEQKVDEESSWVLLEGGVRVYLPRVDPEENQEKDPKTTKNKSVSSSGYELTEKVCGVWGSTAGAGSDFFHVYRKLREREMTRLEEMERVHASKEEQRMFQEQRTKRLLEFEEKMKVKKEKRKVKRSARAQRKLKAKNESDSTKRQSENSQCEGDNQLNNQLQRSQAVDMASASVPTQEESSNTIQTEEVITETLDFEDDWGADIIRIGRKCD